MRHTEDVNAKTRRRILNRYTLAALGGLIVVFVIVALLSARGDNDSLDAFTRGDFSAPAAEDQDSAADMEMAAEADFATSGSATFAESGSDASLAVPTALTPADLGRDIVYRATITVQSDDVTEASRQAVAIVEGFGGIVFGQTTRTEPVPRVEMTFKVLPGDFSEVLEQLAGVGELVDQSISADDVTERIVDLSSRISTAEVSVSRLRTLLEEATELRDVAAIERELLDRETTLETLRAQLRTLRDQVDLATITLTIVQSPDVLPDSGMEVTAWVSDDADDPCLGSQHLTVEPDSTLYFCLEVENTGAAALTNVTVRSRNLRLGTASFAAQQGSFDRIEPRGLLVAVLAEPVEDGRIGGRIATRGLQIELEVEAVPVDPSGTARQRMSASSGVWVDVVPDESLPGFGDSVDTGAGVLGTIIGLALVVAGFLVVFLPFLAVIAALWWWRRRRRRRRAVAAPQPGATTPPDGETSDPSLP